MYTVEIIKCSSPSYWYVDKIGQFYDIDSRYERDIKNLSYSFREILRIRINNVRTVDFNDIIIHNSRNLKLKKLLKCTL